jgi:hypothetical protein
MSGSPGDPVRSDAVGPGDGRSDPSMWMALTAVGVDGGR